ncbi:I78 family peptidase inhibitor [Pseudorhodobacter sp.]|uniref:I78 family peptidase inhibitor n=1 Tax=Pseudorhodobacter sp. TaxID=1934400 RepID=UPI00264766A1|nr:I78 family peptidase inhibitor [Pseudorhodobacter sp.]MDN5787995.1 hypothetical protein [Pseudorhodobacter sp.]
MKPVLTSILCAALFACTPTARRAPTVSPPMVLPLTGDHLKEQEPDSCGASKLGHLVGQNEGMLRTVALKGRYRAISPDTLVTQEYDAFRLNAYVDDAGTIQRLTCG